jgi:hypothetical protein
MSMSDDRWQARPHALCRITPDDEQLSPPGVWQILAHGPDSPTSWWLMPISHDATTWAADNPGQTISRCIQLPGNRLRSNHQHALHHGPPRST